MQQLSLELEEFLIQPDFEYTVTVPNRELIEYLQNLPSRLESAGALAGSHLKNEWVYIWGEKSTGKTHILQAMYHFCKNLGMPYVFLSPKDHENAFILHDQPHIYCIDDVDYFNPHQQTALFNLINQTRIHPLNAIIMTGQKPPLAYQDMREDLRTRLGWGLVYQLKALNLAEQKKALLLYAQQKNLDINPTLIDWLQKNTFLDVDAHPKHQIYQPHMLNKLNQIKDVLNLLDTYSLMHKKTPSILLIKKMLVEMV
jgi:DnaA-homolog protein